MGNTHMRRVTRRELLKLGAGAAVALGVPQLLAGCGGEGSPAKVPSVPEAKARVAAVRGDDLYAMTRDAMEAMGGAGRIVHEGETVFIKPNMSLLPFVPALGNRFVTGECTKPEIVIAVAEECLRAGASEVIVGDGSQLSTFDWALATTLDGSTNLAAEAARLSSTYKGKVTLACLDADSPLWDEVPTSTYLGKVAISSLVARANRIISVPVMKTHRWAQLTLSLKNFVGVTPLVRYGWNGAATMYSRAALDHSSPAAIAQLYLDIVKAVKPDLAIIDASIGVEDGGPSVAQGGGVTVDMKNRLGSWLLLASTDLVAADATAARVMSQNADDVKQIVMGYEMGLGEMREGSIEIDGEKLDNLRVQWRPAKLVNFAPQQGRGYIPDIAPAYVVGHPMGHSFG
jgi:uncharacterized protein (DUF362 family)